MKEKILLLNPPINDFSQYDLFSKPYGLMKIANLLKILKIDFAYIDCLDKDLSYFKDRSKYIKGKTKEDGTGKFYKSEIELPDTLKITNKKYFRFGLTNEDFENLLFQYNEFDYIFININFSFHYNIIYEIVPILKKHSKNSKIYIGGIFSILYEAEIKNNYKDLLNYIDGIGPKNLNDFLIFLYKEKLINDRNIYQLKDYLLKLDYSFLINEKELKELNSKESLDFLKEIQNFNINLDKYIFPLWDLYNELNYGILRTTIGCPFKCKYCASKVINKDFFIINKELLIKEIEKFFDKKISNIAFYDDALLFCKENIIDLFKIIDLFSLKNKNEKENNFYFSFYLPNAVHIKFFDDEIAFWFKKLNFKMIRFGFESLDESKNKIRGEKFRKEDLDKLIEIIEKNNINKDYIKFYLLIGLPDQTIEEVKYSVNYLTSKGFKTYFAFYSPIKGTFYYEVIMEEFRKGNIKNDITDFLWHNPAIFSFFNTHFNEELVRSYKRASREGKLIK